MALVGSFHSMEALPWSVGTFLAHSMWCFRVRLEIGCPVDDVGVFGHHAFFGSIVLEVHTLEAWGSVVDLLRYYFSRLSLRGTM
jgi:hypothetical protein